MSDQKTTVYLDSGEYQRLRARARSEGRSAAELIREAVAQYMARGALQELPGSVGAGRSASGDLSEQAEDLLAGIGEGQ
jgi:hypothetical protein